MGRFKAIIFVTTFAIGDMAVVVAQRVRQVRLQAPSSASIGPLPAEPPGLTDHKLYICGTQGYYYMAVVHILPRMYMVSENTSNIQVETA